jgi:Spy/CpxP family protein refolding chaperone
MRYKYLLFTMKHLLLRLSAGLLLAVTATTSLPAFSQPTASPSSSPSTSSPAPASSTPGSNPLLRGVTLTSQQKSQLMTIQKDTDQQLKQTLTPAQKKLVAKGSQISPSTLTKAQKEKIAGIIKASDAKVQAVFTPEQIKQIKANAQTAPGANGQVPASGPK